MPPKRQQRGRGRTRGGRTARRVLNLPGTRRVLNSPDVDDATATPESGEGAAPPAPPTVSAPVAATDTLPIDTTGGGGRLGGASGRRPDPGPSSSPAADVPPAATGIHIDDEQREMVEDVFRNQTRAKATQRRYLHGERLCKVRVSRCVSTSATSKFLTSALTWVFPSNLTLPSV